MKKNKIKKLAIGITAFSMLVCAVPVPTQAAKVKLNKKNVTLYVGSNTNLKVKGISRKTKVKWSSTNKKIATVTKKGKVKAKTAGNVVIKAKVAGKKVYKCKVTVINPYLNTTNKELMAGETFQLTITGTKAGMWTSSDASVVIVDNNGNLKAIKAGTATISCKGENGNTYICTITVREKAVDATQNKPTEEKPVEENKTPYEPVEKPPVDENKTPYEPTETPSTNGVVCATEEAIKHFHELAELDQRSNGQGVYWDGKEATMVEDVLDEPGIMDGRYGPFCHMEEMVEGAFMYEYTDSLGNLVIKSSDPEHYVAESGAFQIAVDLVDYDTEKARLDADVALVPLEEANSYESYQYYRGIIHREDGDYAGYVRLVWDENKAYRVSCSGKGILDDIKVDASEIIDSFCILETEEENETPYLNTTNKELTVDETFQLTITGTNASKWISSDKSVVTVDNNGNLKAHKTGTATISCAGEDGNTYTCTVHVVIRATEEAIKHFHELAELDQYGDGQGVYWDGKEAIMVKDELDEWGISDGRHGPFRRVDEMVEGAFGYGRFMETLGSLVIRSNDPEHYVAESGKFQISVDLVDYDAEKAKLDADVTLVPLEEKNSYRTYQYYRGIIHREDGDYAGYVRLVGDENKAYRVSCSGTGILDDIDVDALTIINSFYILY